MFITYFFTCLCEDKLSVISHCNPFKSYIMKFDKKSLIRWKIYIDRARMYIGYINFFMMVVIFINSVKGNTYGKLLVEHSFIAIPLLIIIFIGGSLILGYFDSKLGIRSEEMRNASFNNPIQRETLEILRDLKKRADEQDLMISKKQK